MFGFLEMLCLLPDLQELAHKMDAIPIGQIMNKECRKSENMGNLLIRN